MKQFKETLILLLLGSAVVSVLIGNLDDAVSITLAVIIVVTVGFVQEYRSEKSLEALNNLVPHYANLIREDTVTANGGLDGPTAKQVTRAQQDAAQKAATTVSASQLVVGDLILFNTGDRIPADVRITKSADLTIDESNLTGENEAVPKNPTALGTSDQRHQAERAPSPMTSSPAAGTVGADLRLNDLSNIAFMGTLVRSGYGQGLVVATGGATEFGAVSASLQDIESPRTPLQQSMDRLGKDLSYFSFGVIGFIMLVGFWRGWEYLAMFQTGVSLAVAAIPEGLPIIVTVTLALGVFRMSKRHAIVRKLPSVETLGSVNVICSDKTGTLTLNHMTVTKTWHPENDAPVDISALQKEDKLDAATRTIIRIGNIANNGRLSSGRGAQSTAASSAIWATTAGDDSSTTKSRWLGQPTDVAMLDLLDALSEHDVRESLGGRNHETPFSSERKWMGVTIHAGGGSTPTSKSASSEVGYIKGAIEQVLKRCDTYLTKEGREVLLDEAMRRKASEAADTMARGGLRVIAFASGTVSSPKARPDSSPNHEDIFQGLALAGLVGMNDPPRKDVNRSIRRLMAGGVKVVMITGDAETTAIAVGQQLGMPVNTNSAVGKAVIRGDELEKMSEEELSQAIVTTNIFARTSPEHKMKIVRALQARGDVVAMTGDGVNDAPALKKADIGISMGRLGTDVAKEAADMILIDDDFSTILNAIEEGKGIFSNIQNFLTFQLSTSVAALSLVFFSTFLGFQNPLNAMQILWISKSLPFLLQSSPLLSYRHRISLTLPDILMDGPPAQSLGVEPVDPSVMSRPPRPRHARVLTRPLLERVLQSATIIMLGTLLTYVHEMPTNRADPITARDTTMTFTTFVLFDMFNALSCRSESKSVLLGEVKLFGNRMFNFAVAGSLIGQLGVVYFLPLQRVFQTEGLYMGDWVRILATASCVFWADEARKWVKRRRRGRGVGGGYSRNV